jgi:hypothetical protein
MSLNDWLRAGWLTEHQPSSFEVRDLFVLVERDLTDAGLPALSADWRLSIAYNAALQAATAALAACGYRASRESHHYRVIQSLRFTIEASSSLVARFDLFRKKRNRGGYERAGAVSDQEAAEMLAFARSLVVEIQQWLRESHPGLIEPAS